VIDKEVVIVGVVDVDKLDKSVPRIHTHGYPLSRTALLVSNHRPHRADYIRFGHLGVSSADSGVNPYLAHTHSPSDMI